jgi:hypothetical protein
VKSFRRALELARGLAAVEEALDLLARLGEAHNKAGHCEAALAVLEQRLELAEKFGVTLQVVAGRAALGGVLCNLKRYDRALNEFRAAMFSKENALPPLLRTQLETDIQYAREQLGVALLRELPGRLARKAKAVLANTAATMDAAWAVDAALVDAVHGASAVLRSYLGEPDHEQPNDGWETIEVGELLTRVGSMLRKYVDEASPDPESLPIAARYLLQLDRARRTRQSIEDARKSLARPGPFSEATSQYVLYLRSFVASERLPRVSVEPWGSVDLEDILAGLLDEWHSIALGRTELDRFGPGRLTSDDAEWKDVVRVLANEAHAIIVLPVCTEGTCWEIDWVTTNKLLSKTVFVMPPSNDENADWWARKWRELSEWALHMRLRFPEYSTQGVLFRVTRDGQLATRGLEELFAFLFNWRTTPLPDMLISDMLYGIQQGLADEAGQRRNAESEAARGERVLGYAKRIAALTTDEVEAIVPVLLEQLECGEYGEFQNWAAHPTRVPEAPGVIAFYEGPSNVTFVQAADNLRSALEGAAKGESGSFTRGLWNFVVKPHVTQAQIDQLNRGEVTIERLVSFHVRSWYTYRYLTIDDAALRARIVALVNEGAFERGRPHFKSTG